MFLERLCQIPSAFYCDRKLIRYYAVVVVFLIGFADQSEIRSSPISAEINQSGIRFSTPLIVPSFGHRGGIESVAISPDGNSILTGSYDGSVRLWDKQSGRELRRFSFGSLDKDNGGEFAFTLLQLFAGIPPNASINRYVSSVAFTPDGRQVAAAFLSGKDPFGVRLWDVQTGFEIKRYRILSPEEGIIAFSPNEQAFVSSSYDGFAYLWDKESGEKLQSYGREEFSNSRNEIRSLSFSPDGHSILAGYSDSIARRWDTHSGKELQHFLGHAGEITAVDFSPDGRLALTGSVDRTARLWNITNARELHSFVGHTKEITAVDFSPDGRLVLTGSNDGTARVWDSQSGKELHRYNSEHDEAIHSVAFSPDGHSVLLTGGSDKIARLWDVNSNQELVRYTSKIAEVNAVAFSPDRQHLLVGRGDNTAQLWDFQRGMELRRFTGHTKSVRAAVFSATGNMVLTGSDDGTANLYDTQTADLLFSHIHIDHSEPIWSVALSQSDSMVLTGSQNGIARLTLMGIEIMSYTNERTTRSPGFRDIPIAPGGITSVAISPDQRTVLTGSEDGTVRLWDADYGQILKEDLNGVPPLAGSSPSLTFSTDGRYILIGSLGKNASLIDAHTGTNLVSYGFKEHGFYAMDTTSVAFSPDDSAFVVTGHSDGTVRLWDTLSGRELFQYTGHDGAISSVAVSLDGLWVLTGSKDGTARIWSTQNRKEIARLISFRDGNWAVIAPDGRYDSSNPGDLPGLSWVLPEEPMRPYPVEVFMKAYYEPRLLPRLLAGEQFPPIKSLSELNRVQPKVEIKEVRADPNDPTHVSVIVEVANQERDLPRGDKIQRLASGVQDVRLFRDGQLVGYAPTQAGDVALDPTTHQAQLHFDNIRLPSSQETIIFSAYAFNVDGVKSETHKLSYLPSNRVPTRMGRSYIVAIGVSEYQNTDLNLRFADADAQALQETLKHHLSTSGRFESVVPIVLRNNQATKTQIQAVFQKLAGKSLDTVLAADIPHGAEIRPATPDDLLVIFYSGHGYAKPGSGRFYLFPHDIDLGWGRPPSETDLQKSVSTDDLAHWLRDVDAGEMMMIVDACNASASVEGDGEHKFKPGPMGSRGFGQLAYDKAMRVLAASQTEEVAREFQELQHGLLTYVLVQEGIEKSQADFQPLDRVIRAGEWLTYGLERVPKLNEDLRKGLSPVKGLRPVALPEALQASLREIQQPSLFDFARKHRDFVVSKLRE